MHGGPRFAQGVMSLEVIAVLMPFGTGPILLNWAAPPTSERSSTGRGILISAHLSRATRGTIGRLWAQTFRDFLLPFRLAKGAASLHAPAKRFQFLRVVGLIDPLVGRKLGRDSGPASIVSKPAHPVPGARPPDEPSGLSWDRKASTLVDEATACLWGPGGGTALDYLRGRGLTEATVRAAGLGFTPAVMIPTGAGDRCFRFSGIVIPWRVRVVTILPETSHRAPRTRPS